MFGIFWNKSVRDEWWVTFAALLIGIYSELPALTHPYVIGSDFRGTLYWTRQFRDSALFANDLLTEHMKYFQPWGLVGLYYVLSFVIDPVLISKILPVFLVALSSLYLFKLVRHLANRYAAWLAALIFMTSFPYVERMTGGVAGSFSFPLLLIFLYYLTKKNYFKASFLLVLEALLYPVIFFISVLTYLFMFFKIRGRKIGLSFILGVLLSGLLLYGKYVLSPPPFQDTFVTRKEMIGQAEYYEGGRNHLLPVSPLSKELGRNIRRGLLTREFLRQNPAVDLLRAARLEGAATFLIVASLLFLLWKIKFSLPQELFSLFLASIAMYQLSDWFLPRLYFPSRHLEYSVPLLTLILFAAVAGKLMEGIKAPLTRKLFQVVGASILVFLNFDLGRGMFVNASSHAELFAFLKTLPKTALIAAHPELAAGIPTFATRKVFIQFETSDLLSRRYWEMTKKRTFDFFDAYYAEDLSSIDRFCKENGIDYLVVNERDFEEDSLARGPIYFEPFNTYVKKKIRERRDFALREIPKEDRLFAKNGLFVIPRENLR